MSKNDSAFPIITPDMPVMGSPGVTKREWFAGMALMGMVANNVTFTALAKHNVRPGNAIKIIKDQAYQYADAMLGADHE